MKPLTAALLLLVLSTGCKKYVEKQAQNALVYAMVNGQWTVTSFVQNGTTITTDFDGYSFKYYENKTVDAIKNGTVQKTGNWDGNIDTKTTWASFTGVTQPLSLINGNWHINDSGWSFVIATQTDGTDTKTMRLDKQP
jgi:hypothetical protein